MYLKKYCSKVLDCKFSLHCLQKLLLFQNHYQTAYLKVLIRDRGKIGTSFSWHGFIVQRLVAVVKENPPLGSGGKITYLIV